jgi:hypothetical protein
LLTDLDGDGQNEIVAGNEGLNSRFQPTPDRPVRMYAADFDGNGMIDPMVTVLDDKDHMVPLTTKAQVLKQLPSLKKKYVRTGNYARATIEDIFTPDQLAKAKIYELTTLATTVFRNNEGTWKGEALPKNAQLSPTRAIRSTDVNNDGRPDLILVGNDYSVQVETGRMDAGSGVVLLNDGKGGWAVPPNRDHGFWAALDARRLINVTLANGKEAWIIGNNNAAAALYLTE